MVLFSIRKAHARFHSQQYGPRDAILMTLAGSDGANYFGKQNIPGTMFRRKTGRSRRFLIYALWTTFVHHKGVLTKRLVSWQILTKTLNTPRFFLPFFLHVSRFSLSSKVESLSKAAWRLPRRCIDGSTPFVS